MNYSKKDLEVLRVELVKQVRDGVCEYDSIEKIIRGVKTGEYDLDKTMEQIKEVNELKEKVTLFENNLNITYPNMKFESRLLCNGLGVLQEVYFNNNYGDLCKVCITKDTIWSNFQRMINMRLLFDPKKCEECPICSENNYEVMYCNYCAKSHCYACYVNNFKANHGKVICPFCRDIIDSPDHTDEFEHEFWFSRALKDLESKKPDYLISKESKKKDPVLQAKLEEEARESFSPDITNNKVSHKSRKNKNKNKKKNRRK